MINWIAKREKVHGDRDELLDELEGVTLGASVERVEIGFVLLCE